jgi:hypothetical protein
MNPFKNLWESSVSLIQNSTSIDKNVLSSFLLFQSESDGTGLSIWGQSMIAGIFYRRCIKGYAGPVRNSRGGIISNGVN